ncbi:regulator of G-protein signaling 9-like isoform X4 [Penaeus japonicus]|uniref:regulator of G-protein signaling 9-like isoform X4 n=1 Tax=Penaeus japonicus TaxID=27405 RepID=UPI001C714112|nr:regulator of G-protein signaling 9-like isoform X4 [Penaeus japonicus]
MDGRHAHAHATAGPKPLVFAKVLHKEMEALVREMQDPETGVPIRSQKWFLTSIPSSFMGYDLIEWLMERLEIEDSVLAPAFLAKAEAIHLANLLCQYGYFFPVGESRSLIVKDDSSLYRFQTPYYWPSQNHSADSTDYAIYLTKRLSRNKQKHGLEDYELEAYNKLKKTLSHKWDFITMQADEQVKLAKDRKKGDKIVTDSQERAYWRVYRPPPGFTNCLEIAPVPDKTNMANRVRKKTVDDLKKDNEFLATAVCRTRQKVSQAGENLLTHYDTYAEYDPQLSFPLPSNPWITEENVYWILNSPKVDTLTEKRVRRWAISMEELLSDPTGKEEFTNYLRKEYCHENIRFWDAVNELRWGPASDVAEKVQSIYEEFLKPGAPCEINIDGKTMEKTQLLMKQPTRYTYDLAAEHVYVLLLKKDCYPRFLRSEMYKNLIATAIPLPPHKKRPNSMLVRLMAPSMMLASGPDGRAGLQMFPFNFGPGKKKASTASAPNNISLSQTPQPLKRHGSDEQTAALGGAAPHGSSSSVGDEGGLGIHIGGPSTTSNKLDCDPPYRGDLPSARYVGHCNTVGLSYASEKHSLAPVDVSQSNTVCPWESNTETSTANVCPWETSAPPTTMQSQHSVKGSDQKLSHPKARPDRSKSVDVSSLSKRHGSVSVAPSLVPVLSEGLPTTSICPWENQELPNRTTEKSKSIDVDVCPWEVNEPVKKASTSSAPGMVIGDSSNVQSSAALQAQPEHAEKPSKSSPGSGSSISFRERGNKESSRPPNERKISIQVCPWEKVEEEIGGAETHSSCIVSDKPLGRRPSDTIENRLEQATKPKEKYASMNVTSTGSESQVTPETLGMQMALEPRQGAGSEGTSSPSSTCSSSSHSDSRRIKIDYTVRSGHLPGQYGLPIITTPMGNVIPSSQQTVHGHVGATLSSGNTSTSSSSSAGVAPQTTTRAESPRAAGTLPCPAEGGSKPSSPKVATNVVAPWEENPQKMTDICPWEDDSLTPTWL